MWWWFWLWILFIILLIFVPLGYGSGYRRWGAPYPRYYRDRRGRPLDPAAADPADPVAAPPPPETGWRWFGDILWLLIIAAIIWIIVWARVY
jgi:hypothetical protein